MCFALPPAHAREICASLLLSELREKFARAETPDQQKKVAQALVTTLKKRWNIDAYVHRRKEENSVLIGIYASRTRNCALLSHWLVRTRCHLAKRGFQLVLDFNAGKAGTTPAWVMDEPRMVGLSVDALLSNQADAHFVHEWQHMDHSDAEQLRKRGLASQRSARFMPQLYIVDRAPLPLPELERDYGGSKEGSFGHWLEEADAYLKEARFQLANARAELRKWKEGERGQDLRRIAWRLKEARECFRDFRTFYAADLRVLERLLTESVRMREVDGGEMVTLELVSDGSYVQLSRAGVTDFRAFFNAQIAHLKDLKRVADSAHARLKLTQRAFKRVSGTPVF